MDLGLAGKSVIVTGGGSNIGRSVCLTFAKEGANVAIAEIMETVGQRVLNELKAVGGRHLFIKTDITKPDQVEQMVKKVLDEFGRVDVLVNNAGWTYDRLFIEKPREEWEREINLNLWGTINCIRAVIEHMIAQRSGRVVSIGSDAGRMGEFREAVYSATKGGIIALSKSLAREVGRYGITFNVVCPGVTVPEKDEHASEIGMWAKTPDAMGSLFTPEVQEKAASRYPLRRLGKPQDMANAVVFLASDAASYITGQTLSVSGGYTMM